MRRASKTFHKLVEDYTGKHVLSLELVSDNHSTAMRARIAGQEGYTYFLCIDNPPIGRRPLLTAIEIEEVHFDHWPPTRGNGDSMLMSIS